MRKLKSHVLQNGAAITVSQMHAGVIMTHETKNIRFVSLTWKMTFSKHRTGTKQNHPMQGTWMIETRCSGDVELRAHTHILLNAAGASAGDALLIEKGTLERLLVWA